MKNKAKFFTAFTAFTAVCVLISPNVFANEAEIFSSGSPALAHALSDLQTRGLRARDFSKEVEQTDFNMWDNQHEKNRIKRVAGVLVGDVLFLTDNSSKLAKDLEGEAEVHLVMSHVDN